MPDDFSAESLKSGAVDLFGHKVVPIKDRRGRPSFKKTKENQDFVAVRVAAGWSVGRIAEDMGCDEKTLRKYFSRELQAGAIMIVPVPPKTKIALVSWAYNVGSDAACRSTLVRKANAGDLRGACDELLRWNRAGGRVVRGLSLRRASERDLCLAGLE